MPRALVLRWRRSAGSCRAARRTRRAGRDLDAELWLVHRRPDGVENVQRLEIHAGQSGMGFFFRPTRVETTTATSMIEVAGDIRPSTSQNGPALAIAIERVWLSAEPGAAPFRGGSARTIPLPAAGEVISLTCRAAARAAAGAGAAVVSPAEARPEVVAAPRPEVWPAVGIWRRPRRSGEPLLPTGPLRSRRARHSRPARRPYVLAASPAKVTGGCPWHTSSPRSCRPRGPREFLETGLPGAVARRYRCDGRRPLSRAAGRISLGRCSTGDQRPVVLERPRHRRRATAREVGAGLDAGRRDARD